MDWSDLLSTELVTYSQITNVLYARNDIKEWEDYEEHCEEAEDAFYEEHPEYIPVLEVH